MKTVTYLTVDPKHVNQGSLLKSKNRSGTAISEGLPWRHPTPDPRGPIRFCAILESRNRLFVFGSHLKQLSESHGRLRITPPLLLLMSAVKTRAWQHLETFALGAVVQWYRTHRAADASQSGLIGHRQLRRYALLFDCILRHVTPWEEPPGRTLHYEYFILAYSTSICSGSIYS